MARKPKSLRAQIVAMQRRWPQFEVGLGWQRATALWTGPLQGLEREFTLTVEYGMPMEGSSSLHRSMPVVRVLNPRLVVNFEAEEEAPLPHVYFEQPDIALSPLCLFDPQADEWDRTMLIADTTIHWAARWLAAYEIWEATGRWVGGGRHDPPEETEDAA